VTPYHQFVESGFTDIWELRPGNLPGDTCCQPEDLTNRLSTLDQRIDMIFSLELPAKVKEVRVVGDKPPTKRRRLTFACGHLITPVSRASFNSSYSRHKGKKASPLLSLDEDL
jgi:hypothetical protein